MKRRQEEGGAPQRAGAGRRGGRGSPRGGRGSPRAGRWPGLVPVGRLGGSVHLLLQAGSEVREAVDGWGTRAPRAVEGRPGPMSMGSEGSRETPAATPKGGARERAREGPSGGSQESAGEGGHGGQEGSPIREEPPGSGATPFTGQGPGHSRAPLDRVSRRGARPSRDPCVGRPQGQVSEARFRAFLSPDGFWSFRSVPPFQQQHGLGSPGARPGDPPGPLCASCSKSPGPFRLHPFPPGALLPPGPSCTHSQETHPSPRSTWCLPETEASERQPSCDGPGPAAPPSAPAGPAGACV